ncbi:MAG: FtsH protease activity modulator HflK [Burkholderiales bacterium]|nr:FtsH protease activity modulator HflK [Burkholderiales bacterium]
MALNDPDWGRRRGEGPPDLDELWSRFNQKLSKLLGGKGGSGRRDDGPGGAKPIRGGAWIAAGLVFVVWVASGFYIVDVGHKGVVLRFGKLAETTDPGPRWHLPYPVETAEVVNVSSVRSVEVGYRGSGSNKIAKEALMLTDDENIIDLQFAVQYILKDPVEYLFNNREPDESVKQAAESAIREIVGKSSMNFVLYEGREQVAANARTLIQSTLDRYKSGITISQVTMQNAQAPEQVQAAFVDAVKASQDRERQKNEGEAYANDVIPKARGTAARLMQEAEAYKQRSIATAEGEASRFKQVLTEYKKAPGVTRDRLYIDTMQSVLASSTKVLVDQKSGSNLLMLPLDRIVQMSAAGTAAPAPEAPARTGQADTQQAPAPTTQASPDVSARSRDAFRSRDREMRP